MSSSGSEVRKWQQFFTGAGIPPKIALTYSRCFVEQRMQESMLDDIDKATLVELGVTAVGDQIAILRHIRKSSAKATVKEVDERTDGTTTGSRSVGARERITGPSSGANNNVSSVSSTRRGLMAPDRDDIYHIRMPVGTTPKTKQIMQKHSALRSVGLLKRGSDGVRRSGKEVLPIAEQRLLARSARFSGGGHSASRITASSEVSSTTNDFYERLGVSGMVSDKMGGAGRRGGIVSGASVGRQSVASRVTGNTFNQKPKRVVVSREVYNDDEYMELEDEDLEDEEEIVEVEDVQPLFKVRLSEQTTAAGPSSMRRGAAIQNRNFGGFRGNRVIQQNANKLRLMKSGGGIQKRQLSNRSAYGGGGGDALRRNRFGASKPKSVFDRLG